MGPSTLEGLKFAADQGKVVAFGNVQFRKFDDCYCFVEQDPKLGKRCHGADDSLRTGQFLAMLGDANARFETRVFKARTSRKSLNPALRDAQDLTVMLLHRLYERHPDAAIIPEFRLGRHSSIADIALFTPETIELYELKSELDSFERLGEQLRNYAQVGDRVWYVGERKKMATQPVFEPRVGVMLGDGKELKRAKEAAPLTEHAPLFGLVWKQEVRAAVGERAKRRYSTAFLQHYVEEQLGEYGRKWCKAVLFERYRGLSDRLKGVFESSPVLFFKESRRLEGGAAVPLERFVKPVGLEAYEAEVNERYEKLLSRHGQLQEWAGEHDEKTATKLDAFLWFLDDFLGCGFADAATPEGKALLAKLDAAHTMRSLLEAYEEMPKGQ
jgi:hypothetical protein